VTVTTVGRNDSILFQQNLKRLLISNASIDTPRIMPNITAVRCSGAGCHYAKIDRRCMPGFGGCARQRLWPTLLQASARCDRTSYLPHRPPYSPCRSASSSSPPVPSSTTDKAQISPCSAPTPPTPSNRKCNIRCSFFPYASLSEDRQLLLDALSLVPADVHLCMPEAPTVRMIQNEIERSEAFDILVRPSLIMLSKFVIFSEGFARPPCRQPPAHHIRRRLRGRRLR
jgi:hypothetical protein